MENGRYGASRKAARTNRGWGGWDVARKEAYTQRRKYHKGTIGMTKEERSAYIANKRADWTDDMKEAWKEDWKRKTAG